MNEIRNISIIDNGDIITYNLIDENFYNIIAEQYDNTKIYDINNCCIYEQELYKCIKEITQPEDFNPIKWQKTNLTNLMKR